MSNKLGPVKAVPLKVCNLDQQQQQQPLKRHRKTDSQLHPRLSELDYLQVRPGNLSFSPQSGS